MKVDFVIFTLHLYCYDLHHQAEDNANSFSEYGI